MTVMPETSKQKSALANPRTAKRVVSARLAGGGIAEMVYKQAEKWTGFAIWENGSWRLAQHITDDAGRILMPYAPDNPLLVHNVVLFPSEPLEYGSQKELVADIRTFIHHYVDVSDSFEQIAAYYILFSWIFDGFNELPYLRLRGTYGSGKTRFLQIVGSLCYRPIFASGASTMSPIFHMLDSLQGTLLIDEADFRFSDEKADMVKILNNGNVRGMPVLRAQMARGRNFEPRVYQVFGPKIIAMRKAYKDAALESRFLTFESGDRKLRDDIPLNLPRTYQNEALVLRNKLLLYRFQNQGRHNTETMQIDHSLTPRLNQMLLPLLSIIEDKHVRQRLARSARNHHCVGRDRSDSDDYTWEASVS
jgi:hypothetical protein